MKHVTILVPMGHTSLPNIDGSHQILSEVNKFAAMMGKPPVFEIQLAGISKSVSQRNGIYTIVPDCDISDIQKTDLIIIPAMHGEMQEIIEANTKFLPWIKKQYNQGAEVASLCIAAFLLAETGLLDGKQCATHWGTANQFRKLYPNVNLVHERIITHEDGIYTSGGAYAFLNLLVYLVEKYAGREMAIMTAKAFMIDIDRSSQSPFIMFQGQREHIDDPILKAQDFIEGNYNTKFTVEQLADKVALGRRSFERRFKKATNNTVAEYIQRVKIEAAKKGFETSRKNIYEIMYDVGYSDTKAFRLTFKKITGLTPVEYRNKYNRSEAVVD